MTTSFPRHKEVTALLMFVLSTLITADVSTSKLQVHVSICQSHKEVSLRLYTEHI
jgi:hypothetical protein